MPLSLPVVWSETCLEHDPDGEIWVGMRTRGTEVPERAERIRAALERAGAPLVPAEEHDEACLAAVHDGALLRFLAGAWQDWEAAGLPDDPALERFRFQRGAGCSHCNGTGYQGRSGVYELLEMTLPLVEAASHGDPNMFMHEARRQIGKRTLRNHAAALAGKGRTTLSEVMRISNENSDD